MISHGFQWQYPGGWSMLVGTSLPQSTQIYWPAPRNQSIYIWPDLSGQYKKYTAIFYDLPVSQKCPFNQPGCLPISLNVQLS